MSEPVVEMTHPFDCLWRFNTQVLPQTPPPVIAIGLVLFIVAFLLSFDTNFFCFF
jgi:hypothetical protein